MHRALLLVALLFTVEAHTSQVHHRPITLENVVRFSDAVVVATPADPPTRTLAVDITPKGSTPDPQKWPPYQRTWRRFVVDEVVTDRQSDNVDAVKTPLKKGMVIEVAEATEGSNEALHRSYYVRGMSESPIYSMYETTGTTTSKTTKTPARILMLQRLPGGFVFSQLGAEEFVEHRAAVDKAVAATRAP